VGVSPIIRAINESHVGALTARVEETVPSGGSCSLTSYGKKILTSKMRTWQWMKKNNRIAHRLYSLENFIWVMK